MSAPAWERVSTLFAEALERDASERRAFVHAASLGDDALHDDVMSLIAAHDAGALRVESWLSAAAAPGAERLAPGTLLGPYRVGALAGAGGMGEVYRAERVDGAYRQTVAIKVMRAGLLTAEMVRRFRLEREALARLRHRDIAAIHDAGTAPDGRPYLVLELVDGLPITAYAEAHRLTIPERLRLFCRVAAAVHFAHSRLVIHRDLKPSNILVEPNGEPKLLDFGVSKLLDERSGETAIATRPEVRLLTPEHAAPEQLRGDAAGTAADVYALGVLLFELLAGRRPFDGAGRTAAELERAVLEDAPPAPSTLVPRAIGRQVRGDLDRIVAMALRKEPDRRYASAIQLAEDVERHLAGLPVRAERDTLRYRAGKFVKRNRGLAIASVVAVALLAGFAGAMTVQARRVAAERDRVAAERAAADDLVGVLTRLFDRANPLLVPRADTVRAIELLREADRQVAALAAHPERQARLRHALGRIYLARGEYRPARDHLRAAWAVLRQRGSASRDAARAYHDLARAVTAFDGQAVGAAMLDTSVAWLRRVGGLTASELAAAVQEQAGASLDVDRQRALLDEVVALRRSAGADSIEVASALSAEATETAARGAFERSVALLEASLRILARRLPPEHPQRMAVAASLAANLSGRGQYARAERLTRNVLRELPPSTPGEARAGFEERLALIAAHQGRLGEADSLLRVSLARLRASVGPTHERVGNTQRNLGVVLAARGALVEGLAWIDSAVAQARARGAAGRGVAAYVAAQRAMPLLRLGRRAEARAALRDALRELEATTPAGHAALADPPFMAGVLALDAGDRATAARELAVAVERRAAVLPAEHPKVVEARCALGIARGTPDRAACERYARWGLAEPLLLRRVRAEG